MQITKQSLCELVAYTINRNGLFNKQPKKNLQILLPAIKEFEGLKMIYGINIDTGYELCIVIHDRTGAFERIKMSSYYEFKNIEMKTFPNVV